MPPLQMPSVHEAHRAIYFTQNKKMHYVAMPFEKDPPKDEEEEEKTKEPEEKVAEEEKKEDDNVLGKYLVTNYKRCEQQLIYLISDPEPGKTSQLWNAITTLHEMEEKMGDKNALSFAYCKRRFDRITKDGHDGPEIWHDLEFHNMLDSAKIRMFNEETLALYRELDPHKTNVRLLVLENPFVCKELRIIVWQRMFVFFAPFSEYTKRVVMASDREKMHEKSVVASHIMWGYVAFETTSDGTDVVDPKKNPETATKTAERVHEMQAKYLHKRYEARRNLIRRNIPVIDRFLRMFYCNKLAERMDSAFPHIPERAVLHLPIEKCGVVLDTENSVFEGHSTLIKFIAETKKEIAEKTALSKEKSGNEQLERELVFLEVTLQRSESLLHALKSINPENQILLHLKERGTYQDRGEDIELLYVLNINYDKLREHRDRTKELVEKEEAEEKAKQQKSDIVVVAETPAKGDAAVDALTQNLQTLTIDPAKKDESNPA